MRPSVALVATTSLTATYRSPSSLDLERRQLDRRGTRRRRRARRSPLERVRRDRGEEADAAEVDADHRRRRAEEARERAQDRPVAADRDGEIRARPARRRSRTPLSPGHARARARRPGRTSRRPCATTRDGLRLATAASIRSSRSSGSFGWSACTRWRKNSRLPFGPGSPESTTATVLAPQSSAASATSRTTRAAHLRVADDAALADVGAAGLELRLHEHDRLPARARRAAAPAAAPCRTEMNETSQTTSCGANGSSVRARAFVRSSTVTRGSARSRGWSCP